MDNLRYKISNWLAENKESMINDTMELLKINSESYNREEVQRALNKTMEIAEDLGFKTEIRANGEVGVIFFGKGVETLGILAHIDVVPIGDIAAWTHSPFGEIFEDKIFGRGIIDNKGMVISSLYAMAAVKSLNTLKIESLTHLIFFRGSPSTTTKFAFLPFSIVPTS